MLVQSVLENFIQSLVKTFLGIFLFAVLLELHSEQHF